MTRDNICFRRNKAAERVWVKKQKREDRGLYTYTTQARRTFTWVFMFAFFPTRHEHTVDPHINSILLANLRCGRHKTSRPLMSISAWLFDIVSWCVSFLAQNSHGPSRCALEYFDILSWLMKKGIRASTRRFICANIFGTSTLTCGRLPH